MHPSPPVMGSPPGSAFQGIGDEGKAQWPPDQADAKASDSDAVSLWEPLVPLAYSGQKRLDRCVNQTSLEMAQ
jgi:hypothetical protein